MDCKLSLVCASRAKLPFGCDGVQLYCPRHQRAWCVSTDPDEVVQDGDTLHLQESPLTAPGVECLCEFEHCPFLHEMPVDKDGFVLSPDSWGDV